MKNNQKIPEGWSVKKLGELGSFSKGSGITKNDLVSEGIPCVRYAELYTKYNFVISNCISFVSEEVSKTAKPIKYGDILFAGSGETKEEIGKCAAYISRIPAYAGGDNIILRPFQDNSIFLSYFLNTVGRRYLNRLGQGDSIVHIHAENLKKVYIPIPPLAEQEKIAGILGTWDEAIEKLSSLIEQKKLLKKGLMQRLLTGKTRLNGFTQPWKEVKLGELIKEKRIVIEKGKSLTSENIVEGAIPVIAGGKTSPYSHNKFTHNKPCITISASGAYAGYVWKHITPIWASDCNVLYGTDYDTNFLGCCLEYKQQQIYQLQTGGAQPHVYATDIKIITVPNIDITEQKAIADVLSTADKEIDLLNKKLEALKEQKKGLMQQLLTGQIRVKVN